MSLSKADDSMVSGMLFKNLVQCGVACFKGSKGSRGTLRIGFFLALAGAGDCVELLHSSELQRFFASVATAGCPALLRTALLETRGAFDVEAAACCSTLLRSELSDERDPAVVVDSGGCSTLFGSCVVTMVIGLRSSIV